MGAIKARQSAWDRQLTNRQTLWMRRMLRYNILVSLTGLSYRGLSLRVTDSARFQCLRGMLAGARIARIAATVPVQ